MAKKILALCGGVGGVKLALGLSKVLPGKDLVILVNTGDDFVYHGLSVSPDLDTVMYALAGVNDEIKGWGIQDETWKFLNVLKKFEKESWFQLGDKDLLTHIERTFLLNEGVSLSKVTKKLAYNFGVHSSIFPMSETPVSTYLSTNKGEMSFQEYFVKFQCKPIVNDIQYLNNKEAKIPELLEEMMVNEIFSGVIICPSNPYLSIDPILSIQPIKNFLMNRKIPVLAVSPMINSLSVKGPTVKIILELGKTPSTEFLLGHYEEIIDFLILDERDKFSGSRYTNIQQVCINILMRNIEDKKLLAEFCLKLLQ